MIPTLNPYRRGDPKNSYYVVTVNNRKSEFARAVLTNYGGIENCRRKYENEIIINVAQGAFSTIVKAADKEKHMHDLRWVENVRKGR